MRGPIRNFATQEDIRNGMNECQDATKAYLQSLLDDRYCIVSAEELPEGEEGRNEPPLYRSYEMTSNDENGKVLSKTVVQQAWSEDENAALFRLGLTVEEAEKLVNG